eukprot:jgi/Psemu1/10261/gm1.10261_g
MAPSRPSSPTPCLGSAPVRMPSSFRMISPALLALLPKPVNPPIDTLLPDQSYNNGFTTWLAATSMCFLATKNQAFSLHHTQQHSLFVDAANWTNPGPGHTILSQLSNDATTIVGLPTTTTRLQPPTCLPFIDDTPSLIRLRAVNSAGLPDTVLVHALQREAPAQPHTGATTARWHPRSPADHGVGGSSSWPVSISTTMSPANTPLSTPTSTLSPLAKTAAAFNGKINRVTQHCCANNVLPFVNVTHRQFNRTLLCVVTNLVMMQTPPLKQNADILDLNLSISNFLCTPHGNNEFRQQCTHSDRLYEAEAFHIEKAKHRTRHSVTTLFVYGSPQLPSFPPHSVTRCRAQPCVQRTPLAPVPLPLPKSPNMDHGYSSCDQARQNGLFVLKGDANRPHLDNPLRPNKARMCLSHWCSVGSFCPRRMDSQCKFFHATTWWAQLSTANKKL